MAYSNTGSDEDTYGFDCKFVEEPPTRFICPICAMILRDPHQTQCCGAHYCNCCVQQLVKRSTPCPACRGFVRPFRDVSVTQNINALKVKCSNSYWGCEWTGQLGHLGEHSVTCEQKPAKCSSCGLFVPKEIIRDHETLHCPQRMHTCTYCSNYTSTYEDVTTKHWPVCSKYPIDCPNGCSSSVKIPRDQLMTHLKVDCQIQQKIKKLSDTIEGLEIMLEQKEHRIEELEAEIQGSERHGSERHSSEKMPKKSRSIFRRRGSRPNEDPNKDGASDESASRLRVSSDDTRGLTDSVGKERNPELEVKVLKECIAEKVSEIEQLRLRNVEQCTSMAQMEEDFTAQLKAMKTLCKRLSDEKEELQEKLSQRQQVDRSENSSEQPT